MREGELALLAPFGDLRLGLDVNFVGAPALRRDEFGEDRSRTVVGASL